MKKHLIFLLLICCSLQASAQFVSIPDTNFRNWLNANGFSACMNGNLMDTTCADILNADTVYCNLAGINNLDGIQYFDNLIMLICSSQQSTPYSKRLDTIPALPNSVKYLSFGYHTLNTLPALPDSLESLEVSHGPLQTLPALPPTLKVLRVMYNNLTVLPALPASLRTIRCYKNFLTALPALPPLLYELSCNFNQILALPSLPDSLKYLYCSNLPGLALPVLPNGLELFDCRSNEWTVLPSTLPDSLHSLLCYYNQLSALPALPSGLKQLGIGFNPITTLPALPVGLEFLNCDSTNRVSLPAILPSTLNILSCNYNPLLSLPEFPPTLNILACSYTLISEIPDLNNDMSSVYISNNPNLTCFPKYQNIDYLYWPNTPIVCLPNAGLIGNATPPIDSLPICLSLSGCNFNWSMYGRIYNDTNSNCLIDTTESIFQNLRVNLKLGGSILQSFIFNTEGYYSFKTGYGNYEIEIDTTGLPFNVVCPAIGTHTSAISAADSTDADLDFGLICKPGYFDLQAKSISPDQILFPGTQVKINLRAGDASLFYGVTCSAGIGGTVEAVLNGPLSYAAPAPGALTPSGILLNTITWNIPDFSLVDPYTDFNILVDIDTLATVTDSICIQLSVSPTGDSNPLNNYFSICHPVHNSLDPNEKLVFPAGNIDTTSQWLNYTLFFQNTGNAPARNIYLLDTLDADLDLNTFEYLSSSHDPIVQLLPSKIARFSFPNIYLADSTNNEPESHGYVQYRIKTKSGLAVGTNINNTAYIYFDFNPAVITNTVQNIVALPVGINEMNTAYNFVIQPNPASTLFTITAPDRSFSNVILTDLTGKVIRKETYDNINELTVSIRDLDAGVYLVTVEGAMFLEVRRLVVIK